MNTENKKSVFVLDFSTGIPYKVELPEKLHNAQLEDVEEWLDIEHGFCEGDIQYMITSEELKNL